MSIPWRTPGKTRADQAQSEQLRSVEEPTPLGHEAVPAAMGPDRDGRGGRRRDSSAGSPGETLARDGRGEAGRGRRKRRRDEYQMVPDAVFTSYYGRPIVKASPWEVDIPAYLFLGGLAAGSSILAAGADLTGRPALRAVARLTSTAALSVSFGALVHDLGRPSRFVNMLRVAKVTSPMSVGTWILTAYAPFVYTAGAAEVPALIPRPLRGLVGLAARPSGIVAALFAPAVASYTGVLLSDTATPTWNSARKHLPFLFVCSAAAASGGMGLLGAPVAQSGPAQRLAVAGACIELAVEKHMEASMGITAEPLHTGHAGKLMKAAQVCTALGGLGALLARRNRAVGILSGAALLAGSACTRFGVFEAGQASAKDPKYTVVPQREKMAAQGRPGA